MPLQKAFHTRQHPLADPPDVRVVSRLTSCNFDPRCATLPQP